MASDEEDKELPLVEPGGTSCTSVAFQWQHSVPVSTNWIHWDV